MVQHSPSPTANPLPEGRSFIFHHSFGAKWGYLVHAHPCYELIGIGSGYGSAVVGDHQGTFCAGDLFLLSPGLPHSFHSDGFLPDGQLLELRILWFVPALIDVQFAPELAQLSPLLARSRKGLQFRGSASARATEIMVRTKGMTSSLQSLGAVYEVLESLASVEAGVEVLAEHETSARFRNEELTRLDALREIIRRRFREPLSLEQAARDADLSVSTLNHLLRKYSRTTFLQYLSGLRLEEAKRLLRETGDDITSIAFGAGFGSLATFNRRFRAAEQVTPQDYRIRHQ